MARSRRRGQGKPAGRAPECPLCGNPVRDVKTAILERESGKSAHFDCVVREIAKGESLESDERISYLGKGTFGVLSFRGGGGPVRYLIRKRIQYESPEKKADLRESPGGRPSSPESSA